MSTEAAAVLAAARTLAIARAERDGHAATGGPAAVAQAAAPNATPQQQENVARLYESLRERGASAA